MRSLTALGAAAALLPAVLVVAPQQAGAAVVRTITPSDNMKTALEALRPGDTLRLAPGVYQVGYLRPATTRGTAAAPITVVAADPARPPLLRGSVKLFDIDYWRLSTLRVEATEPGFEALYIGGGRDWYVGSSEFFGANRSGAYANVTISGSPNGSPANFRFAGNCVHDAGMTTRENTDHNIYVNFPGRSGTGGRIEFNLIFRHNNGAGIKLGDGGALNAPGPWGVRVGYNTIIDGGRQILLHGDIRYNTISGNILAASHEPFTRSPQTTAIYVHDVTTRTNSLDRNYFWSAHMAWYDPAAKLMIGAYNRFGPFPGFTTQWVCDGYRTTEPAVAPYGRWGTGRF